MISAFLPAAPGTTVTVRGAHRVDHPQEVVIGWFVSHDRGGITARPVVAGVKLNTDECRYHEVRHPGDESFPALDPEALV